MEVWSKMGLLQILTFLSSFLNMFCNCGVTKYLIYLLFAYHNKSLTCVKNWNNSTKIWCESLDNIDKTSVYSKY